MPLTDTGLVVPAATDAFDPQGDLVDLANSTTGRIIVPVANVAARTALAGKVLPTTGKPLFVYRADAAPGRELEYSTDGTTWTPVTAGDSGPQTPTLTNGWGPYGSPYQVPTVQKINGVVHFSGMFKSTGGSAVNQLVGTLPVGFRPGSRNFYYVVTPVGSSVGHTEVFPDGNFTQGGLGWSPVWTFLSCSFLAVS